MSPQEMVKELLREAFRLANNPNHPKVLAVKKYHAAYPLLYHGSKGDS